MLMAMLSSELKLQRLRQESCKQLTKISAKLLPIAVSVLIPSLSVLIPSLSVLIPSLSVLIPPWSHVRRALAMFVPIEQLYPPLFTLSGVRQERSCSLK